jgi:hypothetical protein
MKLSGEFLKICKRKEFRMKEMLKHCEGKLYNVLHFAVNKNLLDKNKKASMCIYILGSYSSPQYILCIK